MTYQIPEGYQLIPVSPHVAQVVPTHHPPAYLSAPSNTEEPVKKAPIVPLLLIGGAIGLLILGVLPDGSDQQLQAENQRLYQENLYLRNEINQLQHQLMGIYSAQ